MLHEENLRYRLARPAVTINLWGGVAHDLHTWAVLSYGARQLAAD